MLVSNLKFDQQLCMLPKRATVLFFVGVLLSPPILHSPCVSTPTIYTERATPPLFTIFRVIFIHICGNNPNRSLFSSFFLFTALNILLVIFLMYAKITWTQGQMQTRDNDSVHQAALLLDCYIFQANSY